MNIYLIVILVFSIPSLLAVKEDLDKIPLKCKDPDCSNPISEGSIVSDYPSADSKYKIKLTKGDRCEVFGMSEDGKMLLARVKEQEGFISNIFFREEKVMVPQKSLVNGKWNRVSSKKKEQDLLSRPTIKNVVELNKIDKNKNVLADGKKSFEVDNNINNDTLVSADLTSEQNFTSQETVLQNGNYSMNVNESKIEPSPTLESMAGNIYVNDSFNNVSGTNNYTYKTKNAEKKPLDPSNGDGTNYGVQNLNINQPTVVPEQTLTIKTGEVHIGNTVDMDNVTDYSNVSTENAEETSPMLPGNESIINNIAVNLGNETANSTEQQYVMSAENEYENSTNALDTTQTDYYNSATTVPESTEIKPGAENKITEDQFEKTYESHEYNITSPVISSSGLDKFEINMDPMLKNESVGTQMPTNGNETHSSMMPVTTNPEYAHAQPSDISNAGLTDGNNLKTHSPVSDEYKSESESNKNSEAISNEVLNELHTSGKDLNTDSLVSVTLDPEVNTYAVETNLPQTPLNTLPETDKSQSSETANEINIDATELNLTANSEPHDVKVEVEPPLLNIIPDTSLLNTLNDTHSIETTSTIAEESIKIKMEMESSSENTHSDIQPQDTDLNKSEPSTMSFDEEKTVLEVTSKTSPDTQQKSIHDIGTVETSTNEATLTIPSEQAKPPEELTFPSISSDIQPTESVEEIYHRPTDHPAEDADGEYKGEEYDDNVSESQKRPEVYEEIGVTIRNGGDSTFSVLYSALASFQELFSKSPNDHGDLKTATQETDKRELDSPTNVDALQNLSDPSEEVETPYEQVSNENYSEGDNSWMSWKTMFILLFTSGVIVVFSLGNYYIESSKRDVELMMKNNSLADELFILQKERITLEERLQESEEAVKQFSKESSLSTHEVETLKTELSQLKMEKMQAEEKEQGLIKKCNMLETNYSKLRQLFSENKQKGERSALIADIKKLKESSNNEILSLKEQLELKSEEIKTLMVKLQKSNDTKDKLEEKLNFMMSEEQVAVKHYQDSVTKLEQTIEDSKATVIKLEDEMGKLKKECESLTIEKELAESALQKAHGLKSSESLSSWLDAKDVRLSLVVAEKKLLELTEEKAVLQKEKEELLDKQKLLEEQVEDLNNKYEEAEKAKIEGLTRLKVLSDYFTEKETQLQEQLGTKEALWLQKQSDDHTIYEQMRSLREENQTFKSQNETLRKEIIDQETSFKKLIANAEEKADGYWVSLRQAERRLKESQVEAAQLRNRLTNLEISGDHLPEDKLKGMEVNGDMPPFGPATSPPFMLYPGEFIPPPPLISAPSRPPPLGRISSPTLGDFTPPLPLPPFDRYPPSPPPPPPQYLLKPQPRDGVSRKQKDSQSSNHSSESTNEKSQRRSKR